MAVYIPLSNRLYLAIINESTYAAEYQIESAGSDTPCGLEASTPRSHLIRVAPTFRPSDPRCHYFKHQTT